MFCSVNGAVVNGVEGKIVKIETDVSDGLPMFEMVGLLSPEVREARERVRSSLKNVGISMPPKRITINISPAAIRKEGTQFDLPIAVGILCAMGVIERENVQEYLFAGELSLNGGVEAVCGILPIVDAAAKAGIKKCIIPKNNINEGSIVDGVDIVGVESISEVIAIVNGGKNVKNERTYITTKSNIIKDFSEVYGQENVIRAALIAACGMHHFLMIGTQGSGKTMIASRIPYILPRPSKEELIEITKIYSVSGNLKTDGIMSERPFRAPHHTVTTSALMGGGRRPRCGEVSLAHRGVLFLDELAEFKSDTVDALRQPLEEKKVTITRMDGNCEFPADFMLVAATNPCKCGYYPDRNKCQCNESDVKRYLSKISGPILDRIDICVSSPSLKASDMGKTGKYNSKDMKQTVERVRGIQKKRFEGTEFLFNSQMTGAYVKEADFMTKEAGDVLEMLYDKLSLTARSYFKIIKVARTIADMEDSINIEETHILEAAGYRLELW